ncbi:MAG: NADH-quinone oxidoreductase subunit J, partial [Sulfolobaceae archaeon]
FYSAVSLAFLGISIAVLIALLSPTFAIYSVIHLLLYVGATVVFLVLSLVMFRGILIKEAKVKWAPFVAVVVTALILVTVLTNLPSESSISAPLAINLTSLSTDLLAKYWFPIIVIIIALITTIIEAISIARRD